MRNVPGLLALALLAAAAPGARAEEVSTTLHGKVASVTGAATAALAAKGVTVGSDVTATWTIESTTPGIPSGGIGQYTVYHQALTAFTVTIGEWQATQFLPPFLEDLAMVQVGDESPGGGLGDSYLLSDFLVDTELILTGGLLNASCSLLAVFADADAKTISNEGVIQDASKFLVGTAGIAGTNGLISIDFDMDGDSGGGTSIGPGLAQKGQLRAGGKYGSTLLRIFGKSASQPPTADPLGTKEAESVDKAGVKFEKQFLAAVDKAIKKGGSAPLPGSAQGEAAENVSKNAGSLEFSLLTGANPDDKLDRQLRGKLLKAAAAKCAADMSALAIHAFKPDAGKLADKLAKAEDVLLKKVEKALEAADKKGVVYTGPSGAEIADAVLAMAEDFDQLTQGVAPAVQAATVHAESVLGGAGKD